MGPRLLWYSLLWPCLPSANALPLVKGLAHRVFVPARLDTQLQRGGALDLEKETSGGSTRPCIAASSAVEEPAGELSFEEALHVGLRHAVEEMPEA